ncbi:single-stranded-DNA-specific exonuclease RecJ [Clostridiaceae bacterium M8S5]|nr:single-stranded-DNA-specific exonuclease RecJ [Clostridiaceae bacterium M8S5]
MNPFFINNNKCNEELVNKISKEFGISKLVSTVLVKRGLTDLEDCKQFLYAKIEDLYDPYLLSDMDKAVDRIIKAIKNQENIWIYGDYDVDGVTSTSLLKIYLQECGVDANYYIPNRFTEGYGINNEALDTIKKSQGDLVISVDCGITSVLQAEYCKQLGMDIIITDHHECQEELPNCIAVINPKKTNCTYPCKYLAGVGIAFKLVQSLAIKMGIDIDYKKYLPIVAFGTIADIVPLRDENRIIVKYGLQMINESQNKGLRELIKVCGLENKKITSGHIGYMLAPRINACGRLDSASYGVELFTCDDDDKAKKIAKLLNDENMKRQDIEADILKRANEIIDEKHNLDNEKVLVIDSENWNHGVIGIVSSRITEKYYRPSVMLSVEGEEARGSARSIKNFDMFLNLSKCKNLFIKFGGHEQAAGLSIKKENIAEFRRCINEIANEVLVAEDLTPEVRVDKELEYTEINIENINQLSLLEPFGMGNSSPIFMSKNVKISYIKAIGKEGKHLKLSLDFNGNLIDAVYFNRGHLLDELSNRSSIDIIYTMDINSYNGVERTQLMIKYIASTNEIINKLNNNYISSFNQCLINQQLIKEDYTNLYQTIATNEIIELLKDEIPTVIITNNYFSAKAILEDMSYQGRDLYKKTDIQYAVINNMKKENAILINPVFEKTIFDKFDRVILFDDNYNIKYKDIVESSKILIVEQEEKYKINVLFNKITPSIEEMRIIYKYLLVNKQKKKYNINCVTKEIETKFSLKINKFKFELSMYIFEDCNIIDLQRDKECFSIKLKPASKIDILSNRLYQNYKAIKEINTKILST